MTRSKMIAWSVPFSRVSTLIRNYVTVKQEAFLYDEESLGHEQYWFYLRNELTLIKNQNVKCRKIVNQYHKKKVVD